MTGTTPPEPKDDDDLELLAAAEAELRAGRPAGEVAENSESVERGTIGAPVVAAAHGGATSGGDGGGRRFGLALVLVALVFAAFWPALDAGFVNWDDDKNFLENSNWRGLGFANLAWMFTSFHMAHWHPMTWMSLGLDHVLFGGEPARMHVMNVVYHALAALAAFGVARALFRVVGKEASGLAIDLAAFFAAAVFAVHPLRAESVAWLTERRDVLSGLFFFLALRAWLSYTSAEEPGARKKAWIWSLVLFALAGMSKVAVFVLPFLFLVLDFWPLRRGALGLGALFREKIGLFAVAGVLMVVALYGQRFSAGTMYGLEEHPLSARMVQAGFSTFFYPMKTLKPTGLSPMYELPPTELMFSASVLGPAAIGVFVALLALALFRKAPAITVAWLLFLLTIAPTSGLTQAGSQIAADRYSYLACIAFAFLFGGALCLGVRGRGVAPGLAAVVGSVVVGLLAWRCNAQSAIWTSSEKLWLHALSLAPSNTVALSNLAEVRMAQSGERADPRQQIELLQESIELLGKAYEQNRDPRHLLNLSAAIRRMADAEPERFELHVQNAWTQFEAGHAQAKAQGEPKPIWLRQRAELLLDLGRVDEALQELTVYVGLEPRDAEGRYLLGLTLLEKDRSADALPNLEWAARVLLNDARVLAALAETQGRLGQYAVARATWTRLIDVQRGMLGPAAASDPYVQMATGALERLRTAK